MIHGRNILCISNPLWESDYAKTIVELMTVFSKENKVLYVDNSYTVKDIIQGVITRRAIPYKKVFGLENRLKVIPLPQGQVYVLTPPMTLTINFLPPGRIYNQLLKINGWLIRKTIKKYLKQLDMEESLINIVALNPVMGIVNGRRFNEKLLIYHCYDVIEARAHFVRHAARLEKVFMRKADAVIVTSQGLYEKKKAFSKACFIVKNAANIELFKQGFQPELNPKKIIGYIGSIDHRLDFQLLDLVISNLPDYEFVFVGRITDDEGEKILRKFKNVTLTGAKNVTELPPYVKTFSVGMIPFLKTEFTKGIYPLKINEYLAAGLPIVTTHFSYLDDFHGVISIAESAEEFQQLIDEEIKTDCLEKKIARQEVAMENSWEHRAEEISDIIKKLEHSEKSAVCLEG